MLIMTQLLLPLQLIGSLFYLIIVTIIIPRVSRSDTKRNIFPRQPIVYYLGFYFYSTFTLLYLFHLTSSLTIIINLLLLAVGKVIGLKLRLIGLTGNICGGKHSVGEYLKHRYNASIITSEEMYNYIIRNRKIEEEMRSLDDMNEVDMLNFNKEVIFNEKFANLVERELKVKIYFFLLKRVVIDKILYQKQFVFLEFDLLLKFNFLSVICFPIVSVCNSEKEVVISRMRRKYHFTDEKVYEVYSNQITLEEFNLKSDKVIYNEDTLATLERKIDRFMSNIFV